MLDDGETARAGAADDHVPVGRRPPQLRRRRLTARRAARDPDPAGGTFPDPQSTPPRDAWFHGAGGTALERAGRAPSLAGRKGAPRADPLGSHSGTLIRQQPGSPAVGPGRDRDEL